MPHIKTHIYIDTHFRIYFYGMNFGFGMIFIVQKNPKKVYILVDFCLFLWSVIISLLHICVHFICILMYTLSLACKYIYISIHLLFSRLYLFF